MTTKYKATSTRNVPGFGLLVAGETVRAGLSKDQLQSLAAQGHIEEVAKPEPKRTAKAAGKQSGD